MAKITIIGPSEKYVSGISNYTWRVATELKARPVLYRHMLPSVLFPGRGRVGKAKTKISYPDTPTYLDYYNPITWIYGIKEIRKCDLFIVEWWSSSVAHMLLFICLLSGRRFVIEAHEVLDPLEQKSFLLNAYGRLARHILFNKASTVVVHNTADYESLKYLRLKPDPQIIPHAVYDQFEKGDRIWDKTFNILFFGLIREYKGIEVLLTSFEALNVPNKRLIIVGENWDRIPIPERSNIMYQNKYVSDKDVEFYFSQADVLCMPYTRGSASGVAAIAMHYGLPIVAARVPGIYEQLFDYEGVYWIDVGDTQALTDWLYVINTKDKKQYKVPDRLTWKRVTEQWEELTEELCQHT